MSIEVIVLGRSQDAGVPQAACQCERCAAARAGKIPREFAACLAIVDRSSNQVWLIDATPDFREQTALLDSTLSLAGIFITHAHIGHYAGLMHLGIEAMNAAKLRVFGTHRLCDFLRQNAPWSQLVALRNIELSALEKPIVLNERLQIDFTPVPHRSEFSDTVAFVIRGPTRSLFYCPDIDGWKDCPGDVRKLPDQFDISIIDGTFFSGDELPGRDISLIPHPTIQQTMQQIGDGRGKVFFTHLNHTNPLLDSTTALREALRSSGFEVVQQEQVFSI